MKRKINKRSTASKKRRTRKNVDDLDLEVETLSESEAKIFRIKQKLFSYITKKIQILSVKPFSDGTISALESLRKRIYNVKSEAQLFELLHNITTLKNELQNLERILNSSIKN